MTSFSVLPDLLNQMVKSNPQAPVLHHKVHGAYVPISRERLQSLVYRFAAVLQKCGIKAGDKVALMSRNCPEWVVCDLAIMSIGAIIVPIYPTLGEKDIEYILNDCQAKLCIVELESNLKLINGIFEALRHLENVMVLAPEVGVSQPHNLSYVIQMEQQLDAAAPTATPQPDDIASIVYTSGTTGFPKGVSLTHRNFLSNVDGVLHALPLSDKDSVLSFLPLSHVFERTAGYYTVMAIAGQIYYAEDIQTVSEDLVLARPTVVVSVPRLYEKIHLKIYDQLKGLKKPLFEAALSLSKSIKSGESSGPLATFLLKLADKVMFKKIRKKTGGRLRFFVSGGAPLNAEIATFFEAVGLLIIEGYGQTETSPVIACNRVEKCKFGTVGKALYNVEVKLTEQNELCVRGPSIMKGYYNLDEKTQTVIDAEGWLHTGDVARIDDDGYISITDRLKDIIVLSNGKNVAPLPLEQAVSLSPYISQVVVIGEKRNFVSALVVPNFEKLESFAKANTLEKLSLHEKLSHPKVNALFTEEIEKYTQAFSHFEKIKKFELMGVEFTIESGELTPTLKPKRRVIHEVYADVIARIYS